MPKQEVSDFRGLPSAAERDVALLNFLVMAAREPEPAVTWRQLVGRARQYGNCIDAKPEEFDRLRDMTVRQILDPATPRIA